MKTRQLKRHSAYVLLLLLQLSGCGEPPPAERAIRSTLEQMAAGIEANKPVPVLSALHEDFRADRSGRELNRAQAVQLARLALRRHQNVTVLLTNIRVTPDPVREDVARAAFNVATTSGSASSLLPESGNLYRVETQWRLDGDWKLYRLESRRALE